MRRLTLIAWSAFQGRSGNPLPGELRRLAIVVKKQRGRGEQWSKMGTSVRCCARLSYHDVVDNQIRLQPFALAYNLGNFPGRLALTAGVKHWSLIPARLDNETN